MKDRTNLFVNFNKIQNGASLTSSRAEPIESNYNINLKVFIAQSLHILRPCSNHTLGCNLYLKHHLSERFFS